MSELKTFRVAFTSIYHMRIRLKAGSAVEAIKQAERIYLDNPGDHRVSMWRHEPFADAQAKRILTFVDIAESQGRGMS